MAVTHTLSDEELDAVFDALASEQRRAIVRVLAQHTDVHGKSCCSADELCACKLSEHLGLAPSTMSHHMAILRRAGLVRARKEGTWVYYALDRARLAEVADAIARL